MSIVSCIPHKITQNKPEELGEWNFENELNKVQLQELVEDQLEIGWDNFFKGLMAKSWKDIQECHYATLDLPKCQAYSGHQTW